MHRLDPDTERAARQFLDRIRGRYDLAGAIVYGSRARGNPRPDSDVDLAVILRGERRRTLPIKLDMADTAFDVLLATNVLISPLPVWLDEWEHRDTFSNPALLRNIEREGVPL